MEILQALGHQADAADEKKLKQYEEDQAEIKKEADAKKTEAATHLAKHEVFSRGVTMFQIAIAVGAISVLTKKQVFWAVSLVFGLAGIFFLVQGFLTQ